MPYEGNYFSAYLASYVLLMNDENKVYLMRRANTEWANGWYGVPAGRMERHETFLETAIRETREETSVTIAAADLQLFLIQNRFDDTQKTKDWVDMFFVARQWTGDLTIAEPDKCDHAGWFALDDTSIQIVPNVRDAFNYLKDQKPSFGLFSDDYNYFKKKVA